MKIHRPTTNPPSKQIIQKVAHIILQHLKGVTANLSVFLLKEDINVVLIQIYCGRRVNLQSIYYNLIQSIRDTDFYPYRKSLHVFQCSDLCSRDLTMVKHNLLGLYDSRSGGESWIVSIQWRKFLSNYQICNIGMIDKLELKV